MLSPLKRQGLYAYSLIIILSLFISGCVTLPDPEVSQDSHSEVIGVINSSQILSQTFEIRRNGFNSITVWLAAEESSVKTDQDEILLHFDLYSLPAPLSLIHHTTIRLNNSFEGQAYNISFPSQAESSGVDYSLQFSTDTGTISVYGRNENIYPNGQSFIDLQPVEADFAFSTTYNYDIRALLDDVDDWLKKTYLIPSFIIVLFLPGWLLLKTTGDQSSFDLGQRIGISLGISLAIIPFILLWTSTIGISWTKTTVLFFSGFLVSVWVFFTLRYRYFKQILTGVNHWITKIKEPTSIVHAIPVREVASGLVIPTLLLSIFILSLSVRLIMVRDLATPAWVDSVHHALITRIILETGALPKTYMPYLDLESNFYHPGFHSQLATFQLLSNLDIPSAMLVFGQAINALMIISVYALAKSVTNSNRTAIFAALITGLFTPMPAYYTSWGRYTQLSGLIILPTAYILFRHAMSLKNFKKWISYPLLIAAITASGLFLVHYRVIAFFILLIISDLLINLIFSGPNKLSIRRILIQLMIYSVLGTLFILPWLTRAVPETFIPSLSQPVPDETRWFADFSWRYLSAASGKQALVIGGLGSIWGLIQKKRFALLLMIWIGLLLIFANMGVLGLPGGGLINSTSVEISLFIPISIFGGYFISEVIKFWKSIIPDKLHAWLNSGILISMIFIAIIGFRNIAPILNPVTFLSRQADLPAIRWMEENIHTDEAILINPFLWGYGLYAGNDGGSWITPLTGQKTIPPPVLYALASEDDRELINQINQFVIANGNAAAELHNYLKNKNIHYIYTGARGGPISPLALLNHSGFRSIYENQGVWIFEILPVNAK